MRKRRGFGKELAGHIALKEVAKLWLLSLGASRIDEEVELGERGRGKRWVISDVVGYVGDSIIVVECGGSRRGKLERLSNWATEIYILPYGQSTPFRWSKLNNICHHCGQKI